MSNTHETCRHKVYRLDCVEFDALIQRARDRCEICGTTGPATKSGKLYIDHDPYLGNWAVRGLLCNSCNNRLEVNNVFRPEAALYLARAWRTESDQPRFPAPRKRGPRPSAKD